MTLPRTFLQGYAVKFGYKIADYGKYAVFPRTKPSACVTYLPATFAEPCVGLLKRNNVFNVVDLPAPFPPKQRVNFTRAHSKV